MSEEISDVKINEDIINNENKSTNNSDDEDTSEEEIQFFKKSLQDFLELQQEISTIESALKLRKDKRKKLSESIHTFIQENEIEHINLQGDYSGKQIKSVVGKRKTPLNEKTISNALHKYYGTNAEEANKVLEAIINSRTQVEKRKLGFESINKKKSKSKAISELLDDEDDGDEIPENMKYLYNSA